MKSEGQEGTMRDKGYFITSSEDSVSLRKSEKRNSDEKETRKMVLKELDRESSKLFQSQHALLQETLVLSEKYRDKHATYKAAINRAARSLDSCI